MMETIRTELHTWFRSRLCKVGIHEWALHVACAECAWPATSILPCLCDDQANQKHSLACEYCPAVKT
jgi:hypothetical protein